MLPEDSEWFANSGNHIITKDWTNAIQRNVDAVKADGSADVFPAPTGTTLPWGGGRRFFLRSPAIPNCAATSLDSSIDWRNRWVMVLDAQADLDEDEVVGGTSYAPAGDHSGALVGHATAAFWTGAGQTFPPIAAPYASALANVHIFADATTGKLYCYQDSDPNPIYLWLVLEVSDQFPTRT